MRAPGRLSRVQADKRSSHPLQGEKVVGLLTKRGVLWKFVPLNKRPDEVTVGDMMFPFFRVGPGESTKTAAKMMVENRITRLGASTISLPVGSTSLSSYSYKPVSDSRRSRRDFLQCFVNRCQWNSTTIKWSEKPAMWTEATWYRRRSCVSRERTGT